MTQRETEYKLIEIADEMAQIIKECAPDTEMIAVSWVKGFSNVYARTKVDEGADGQPIVFDVCRFSDGAFRFTDGTYGGIDEQHKTFPT